MIREYRADDLAPVLKVWTEASAVGHPFLSDAFLAAERRKLADVYLPAAETWVWVDDGRVVGFISLIANEVGGLFVDPTVHRRGIGRALVDHARGVRGDLEVEVFKDNAPGRAFYRACGFIELSEGTDVETGLGVVRLFTHRRNGMSRTTLLTAFVALLALSAAAPLTAQESRPFPARVLITNDNGIQDAGLVELARAFARVPGIEVTVVAPAQDRSGATNYLGAARQGRFRVERRDLGARIDAWALDGYPADCVVFALAGPLRDRLPDLVVSGINGGPNLADDWFGSGTIGAARTAAYFGVPAMAVSGLDDADPAAVAAATSWVVRFVRSRLVAALEPPQYLTVSLPVGTPDIRGARIVQRARGLTRGVARPTAGPAGPDSTVWALEIQVDPTRAGADTDVAGYAQGFIVIVPMRVAEYDARLAERLRAASADIPAWIPPEGGGEGGRPR